MSSSREEIVDAIIQSLDDVARDYDDYAYGLPVMSEMEAMRTAVNAALAPLLDEVVAVLEKFTAMRTDDAAFVRKFTMATISAHALLSRLKREEASK